MFITYLSADDWIIKKLLAGCVSISLVRFIMSNSHSSSSQLGDSNNSVMSISWHSRGVARASNPGFCKFKQNADIDSCSLWMMRTGSGRWELFTWLALSIPVKRNVRLTEILSQNKVRLTSCGATISAIWRWCHRTSVTQCRWASFLAKYSSNEDLLNVLLSHQIVP